MRRMVLVALAGCSIATSGAPSRYDGRTPPDCTTSKVLPSLDLGAGVAIGLLSIPLLLESHHCDGVSGDCDRTGAKISNVIGKLFIVGGGLFVLSSWGGFRNVRSCRAAVRTYQGR